MIFDRGFAKPQLQWSIDELQYQIKLIIELTRSEKSYDHIIQQSSIISNEPYIRLTSFINEIKHYVINHRVRSDSIDWSRNENNQWSGNNQIINNEDILIVGEIKLPIKFKIIRYDKEKKLKLCVEIKINDMNTIELPFGFWQEDSIENQAETIAKILIMEFMNFYNIFKED